MPNKLTPTAIEHLREEYREILLDEDRIVEGGSDDVMTNMGYVSLWTDGEVTAACGGLLGKFDDDGDWTPNEDGDDAEGEE